MRIFGREPALLIQAIVSVLYVVLPLVPGFMGEGDMNGFIVAVSVALTAIATAAVSLRVQPIAPTVFTGAITAAATLAGYFGLNLPPDRLSLVTVAVAAVMTLVTRAQQTPVNDARDAASLGLHHLRED